MFQRSKNDHCNSLFAACFVGMVIAAPAPAIARETTPTASYPLPAAYGPLAGYRATAAYTSTSTTAPANAIAPSSTPSPPTASAAPTPAPMPAASTQARTHTAPAYGTARAADPTADQADTRTRTRADDIKAWLLALEAYTSAPVDLGARVTFETPFRLRLSAAYGIVPGAYFGVVNSAVESSGAYDALVADAAKASFDEGHVLRAMIGVRPIGGLYLDAGYARVALAGGLKAGTYAYDIDSTLHMWTADIGYQGAIADRLLLALGVGVMGTFAAKSTVAANFGDGKSSPARAVSDDAIAEYDSKLEQYGIVPTLTLRVGWDFF